VSLPTHYKSGSEPSHNLSSYPEFPHFPLHLVSHHPLVRARHPAPHNLRRPLPPARHHPDGGHWLLARGVKFKQLQFADERWHVAMLRMEHAHVLVVILQAVLNPFVDEPRPLLVRRRALVRQDAVLPKYGGDIFNLPYTANLDDDGASPIGGLFVDHSYYCR
jgi:hypothetical protein